MLDGEIRFRRREPAALQQQVVVDADRTDDAVLDGDEAAVDLARFDRVEDLLAERESYRFDLAEPRQERSLAIRAANALECGLHAPISAERRPFLKPCGLADGLSRKEAPSRGDFCRVRGLRVAPREPRRPLRESRP